MAENPRDCTRMRGSGCRGGRAWLAGRNKLLASWLVVRLDANEGCLDAPDEDVSAFRISMDCRMFAISAISSSLRLSVSGFASAVPIFICCAFSSVIKLEGT